MSEQGRDEPQQPAGEPLEQRGLPAGLQSDPLALGQGVLKICLNDGNHRVFVEVSGTLKVEIQTAVVQIDGAHNRLPVVGDKDLGVDKTGGVLKDVDAGAEKLRGVVFR